MNAAGSFDILSVILGIAGTAITALTGIGMYRRFGRGISSAIDASLSRRGNYNRNADSAESLVLASAEQAKLNEEKMLKRLDELYKSNIDLAFKAGRAEGKAEIMEKQIMEKRFELEQQRQQQSAVQLDVPSEFQPQFEPFATELPAFSENETKNPSQIAYNAPETPNPYSDIGQDEKTPQKAFNEPQNENTRQRRARKSELQADIRRHVEELRRIADGIDDGTTARENAGLARALHLGDADLDDNNNKQSDYGNNRTPAQRRRKR